MEFSAGFAQVDITPPPGTDRIGWIRRIVGDRVLDPLAARVAVFADSAGTRVGIVQLDTLSIRWTTVNTIRRRVANAYGVPGGNVMVCATHNHAGPAVAGFGTETVRDDAYVAALIDKVATAFGLALERLAPAELGAGRTIEWRLTHNRRFIMRSGVCHTHGSSNDPENLYNEGVIDPEVGVIGVRRRADQAPLAVVVNFACHPTHHGHTTAFSAGYPGVVAAKLGAAGWPVALFLNGCCGNVAPGNPLSRGNGEMEFIGETLADDALGVLGKLEFRPGVRLTAALRTLQLPFRNATPEEIAGTIRGAQRFVDPGAYDRGMPRLLAKIAQETKQKADVQVLGFDDLALVGIPAEYFVQHGLRIKAECHPRQVLVASCTNGMVGYVPTREAFRYGGYETTFGGGSRLAPEAGDLLADAAVELVKT
jgi:hypothetical protein